MGAPLPLSYLGGVPKFYMIAPTQPRRERVPPAGVRIQRVEDEDRPAQRVVLGAAYATAPGRQEDHDDEADVDQFWDGVWGTPIRSATFGAWLGDSLVGLAYVCDRGETYPLVAELVVLPQEHARGIGAALLSAVIDACRAEGHGGVTLAVHQDNLGAIHLYARMGFALYAEGCLEAGGVVYRTAEQFQMLRHQFDSVLPGLDLPVEYCVRPVGVDGFQQFVNVIALHRLPVRILGMVTGHRSGSACLQASRRVVEDAVLLLGPAEAATIFDHPNLWSWRRALDTGAERFEVCFGESVSEGV